MIAPSGFHDSLRQSHKRAPAGHTSGGRRMNVGRAPDKCRGGRQTEGVSRTIGFPLFVTEGTYFKCKGTKKNVIIQIFRLFLRRTCYV